MVSFLVAALRWKKSKLIVNFEGWYANDIHSSC